MRLTVLGSGPGGPAVGSVGVLTSRDASRSLGCLGRDSRFCQHVFDLAHDLELDEIHCEITFNELDQTYLLMDKKALKMVPSSMEVNLKEYVSNFTLVILFTVYL